MPEEKFSVVLRVLSCEGCCRGEEHCAKHILMMDLKSIISLCIEQGVDRVNLQQSAGDFFWGDFTVAAANGLQWLAFRGLLL
jgi:hypothetical protein